MRARKYPFLLIFCGLGLIVGNRTEQGQPATPRRPAAARNERRPHGFAFRCASAPHAHGGRGSKIGARLCAARRPSIPCQQSFSLGTSARRHAPGMLERYARDRREATRVFRRDGKSKRGCGAGAKYLSIKRACERVGFSGLRDPGKRLTSTLKFGDHHMSETTEPAKSERGSLVEPINER
jgi:hypothetical protein